MEQEQALDREISFGMMFRFALPTILSSIFMSIYTTVDGIFVSRLIDTNALSAVTVVMPVIMVTSAIGVMFGSGGNALIARKIGEGREEEARQDFSLLLVAAFLVSLTLTVLGFVFLQPLLRLLGADEILMPYCMQYARAAMMFIPFTIFGSVFQMSFITVGKANLGLLVFVLGGSANIALDWLFIAVFRWELAGAAIATGIGYCIPSLIGLVWFSAQRKSLLRVVRPKWRPDTILKSCSNGASEMVGMIAGSVPIILFNNILVRLAGADGVASITIIFYAQGLLSAVYRGYSTGISSVISFNYGRQDTGRQKAIYHVSMRMIMISSVVAALLCVALSAPLVGIFAPQDSAVYDMAIHGFRLFSVCFVFLGMNIYSSAMFTALSNGRVSAILSFCRAFLFSVLPVLILPVLLGLDGVWLSLAAGEFLSAGMSIYYFRKMRNVYHYV